MRILKKRYKKIRREREYKGKERERDRERERERKSRPVLKRSSEFDLDHCNHIFCIVTTTEALLSRDAASTHRNNECCYSYFLKTGKGLVVNWSTVNPR